MIELLLHRDYRDAYCTLGQLELPNGTRLHTIERTWVPNKAGGKAGEKYVSCIGVGQYRLRPHTRPSGERTLAVSNPALDVYYLPEDVPTGREAATRTLVLIHAGNYWYDIIGCIAPGKARVKAGPEGTWMVTYSRDAMNEVRLAMGGTLDGRLVIDETRLGN